jgi:pre-mRNA-splicing factor ATP-dependent RNA helicase DHX38/PRP16
MGTDPLCKIHTNCRYRDDWCGKNFIHPKSMRRAREIRQQIMDIMKFKQMKYISCGIELDIVRRCICSGYFHQAARSRTLGEYANVRTGLPCHLHPTSSLYGAGFLPDYVVYNELIVTSKEYMSTVTSVEPQWLAESGSVFYTIKEKGYGRQTKESTQKEKTKKMELEEAMHADRERQIREQEEAKKRERAKTNAHSAFARIATPGFGRASPRSMMGGGATPKPRRGMGF